MSKPIESAKSMQEHWREYRDQCYPDGLDGAQNRECHQAFFSAAFVILYNVLAEVSQMSDEDAVSTLKRLQTEVAEVVGDRLKTLKQQN